MRIEIGQFEYTECWDGVLYKKLSDYPNITEWEIQNILDFINNMNLTMGGAVKWVQKRALFVR